MNREQENEFEELIEHAYWEFDKLKGVMTERDAFKQKVRFCSRKLVEITTPSDPLVIDLRKVEWPEGANIIAIHFALCDKNDFERQRKSAGLDKSWDIAFIDRPVPAWKPKEGEAVLFKDEDDRAMAGFIHQNRLFARGLMAWYNQHIVKPFDPAKIGLPWDQI